MQQNVYLLKIKLFQLLINNHNYVNRLIIEIYSNTFLNILYYLDLSWVDLNTYMAKIWLCNALQSFIKNRMGCHGNSFIVPSPSVDFPSNNQILKYQCPYYKNMWVYKFILLWRPPAHYKNIYTYTYTKIPLARDDLTFWPIDFIYNIILINETPYITFRL